MTNEPRRPRTDSASNLPRIMAGANIQIAPPTHVPLNEEDYPFWNAIMEEAAHWSPHTLDLAAILARTMGQLEVDQRLLFIEGTMLELPNGSQCVNPRSRAVNRLNSQVLAMRRSLGLTGRAKVGGRSEEDSPTRGQPPHGTRC